MAAFHHLTEQDCLATVGSSPEAERRLAEHGSNRLPDMRGHGPLRRFLAQFHDVLIGAAVISGALQHWVSSLSVFEP